MGPCTLFDMHCHLDLMTNGRAVAEQARERGIALLDMTVTPEVVGRAEERYAELPNVRCAPGLHPWLITEDAETELLLSQLVIRLGRYPFIGEVGLDFSGDHAAMRAQQTVIFEELARALTARPRCTRLISIHAVRSASTALDILERYDVPRVCTCMFHWFSGTSDELTRARRLGCSFSVNERMLATKRGRAYARTIEQDRLYLETDYPVELGTAGDAAGIERSLNAALDMLAEIRDVPRDELAADIARRSQTLLDMDPPLSKRRSIVGESRENFRKLFCQETSSTG